MVIGGVFRDVTNELSNLYKKIRRDGTEYDEQANLDFCLHITPETAPNNLPLTRLKAIEHGRD
jgi:hypothetical protein